MQNMHSLKTMQTMHFMHPGRGVLAYDRDRAVFVAFELDAGRVTAQQQRDIAASQQQRDIAASVEFTA